MVAVVGHYDRQKNTNSIFLSCCYLVIVQKEDPVTVWNMFSEFHSMVQEYGERNVGTCVTILDCLKGLSKAMNKGNFYIFYFALYCIFNLPIFLINIGWFNIDKFDPHTFARMDSVNGGDMNGIIPNKILAFSSPDDRMNAKTGNTSWKLVTLLKQMKLKNILR